MKPPALDYERPDSLTAACLALRGADGATPIAGGQSLLPMLSLRVTAPDRLVDIGRLAPLHHTAATPTHVRLGAATTHAAIEDGRIPDPAHGLLRAVAAGIAYRAIRNFGTIGGAVALADPAADWPACLLALDATVIIADATAEHRIPIAEFILGPFATALEPGQLIVALEIPRLPAPARWGYVKLARQAGAYADSLGAVVLPNDGTPARVVLGATTHRATHLPTVAAALADAATPPRDLIAAAIRQAEPDADPYRHRCHLATIERAIAQARA